MYHRAALRLSKFIEFDSVLIFPHTMYRWFCVSHVMRGPTLSNFRRTAAANKYARNQKLLIVDEAQVKHCAKVAHNKNFNETQRYCVRSFLARNRMYVCVCTIHCNSNYNRISVNNIDMKKHANVIWNVRIHFGHSLWKTSSNENLVYEIAKSTANI